MSKVVKFSNDGHIDSDRVKSAVYNRIDFELAEDLWDKIDSLFAQCWNNEIGIRGYVYENQIEEFIYNGLKKENIILPYEKVSKIVSMIYDYISLTGGFLNEE